MDLAAENGLSFQSEYRFRTPEGVTKWVFGQARAALDENGVIVGHVGTITDITERVQAEQALQDSETLYRDLVETSQDLIWKCDAEGRFIYLNQAWEQSHGYKLEEMLGRPFTDFEPPEIIERELQEFGRHLEGGSMKGHETIHLSKSGEVIHLVFNAVPLYDIEGNIVGSQGNANDITERVLAEGALQDSERRLNDAQHVAKIANWERDFETGKGYWSDEQYRLFGYQPGEIPNSHESFRSHIHPQDADRVATAINEGLANGTPFASDFRYIPKGGEVRHAHIICNVELDETRKPRWLWGTFQDITERVRAEQALRESEETLHSFMNSATDGFILYDADLNVVLINDIGFKMFPPGTRKEDMIGQHILGLSPGLDGTEKFDHYKKVLETGEPFYAGDFVPHPKFGDIYVNVKAFKVGSGLGFIFSDITERVRAEQALRESEAKHKLLLENTGSGIAFYSPEGTVLLFNTHAASLMNGSPQDFLGKSVFNLYDQALADTILERIQVAINSEIGQTYEDRIQIPTGDKWFTSIYHRVIDPSGNVHGVQIISSEITARKQAEQALRESEEKYRQLVDLAQEGIWLIDKESITTFVNPSMAKMLGYSTDEMIGKHIFSFMDEHGVEIATRNVERRKQGIAEQHDFEWLRKDGNRINVTMETAPIIDEDGNYSGAIAGVIDITERMRAEEKIKAALIEKEVLLKEVHHRVKNNLAVVSSLLSLQARNIEDDNIRKIFDESRSRIRSMALVHEDLYQSADLARVNFADYIRALARQLFIIYNIDPDRIQLQIDVENVTLGIDMAVPCGLLINELLTNSIKYAFPGDRSGEVHDVGLYSENDKYVLTVSDDGVGLPQDLDWQETETLGLQLIKALSGQIRGDVELDCSAGTAFRITFPGE